MTSRALYLLIMTWHGGDSYVIERNIDLFRCAGAAAMARSQDERWSYRCQLVTYNAFRLFVRTKPEEMTQ